MGNTVNFDDVARAVITRDREGNIIESRPYTAEENAVADLNESMVKQASVAKALKDDNAKELAKVSGAIDTLKATIGTTSDPAGTTSLRALKAQTNANVITGASIKALINFVIDIARVQVQVNRVVLRLAKEQTGTFDSADVGSDIV